VEDDTIATPSLDSMTGVWYEESGSLDKAKLLPLPMSRLELDDHRKYLIIEFIDKRLDGITILKNSALAKHLLSSCDGQSVNIGSYYVHPATKEVIDRTVEVSASELYGAIVSPTHIMAATQTPVLRLTINF